MKKLITTILTVLLPARVFAQSLDEFGKNLQGATTAGIEDLPKELYNVIASFIANRVFSILTGVAIAMAILFIMYGSLQYFTAYGDENRATGAKKTITYAFIGLIIAFMAMGIAGLVQQSITNNQALQATEFPVH